MPNIKNKNNNKCKIIDKRHVFGQTLLLFFLKTKMSSTLPGLLSTVIYFVLLSVLFSQNKVPSKEASMIYILFPVLPIIIIIIIIKKKLILTDRP
jgi:hypothetical protein